MWIWGNLGKMICPTVIQNPNPPLLGNISSRRNCINVVTTLEFELQICPLGMSQDRGPHKSPFGWKYQLASHCWVTLPTLCSPNQAGGTLLISQRAFFVNTDSNCFCCAIILNKKTNQPGCLRVVVTIDSILNTVLQTETCEYLRAHSPTLFWLSRSLAVCKMFASPFAFLCPAGCVFSFRGSFRPRGYD